MEENVRIVVTGNNQDALSKLKKVEQAVNNLNSVSKQVSVKVTGLQQAEREASKLYSALERLENATLSKLPESLQVVIAYLKAANAGLGEFSKRAITAAAAVGDIGRVPFAPIIKAQSQAIAQFEQMKRGLVSLRVEFVRVFDRGSTQPLLDGLNLVRVSVLETKNLLEGRGNFTQPILDGLDLVKVRILEIRGLLGGVGGSGGGGGRIPPAVPPNTPALPPGRPGGPLARGPEVKLPLKTLQNLEAFRRKLEQVYRTTEIGTPKFEQLAQNIARVTKEIEDAQLRFQKVTTKATPGSIAALREEIAAKEAAFNQTKRGSRRFNELADELRELNSELTKTERFIEGRTKGRKGRVGTALQSAALGGGFPLLFGGPSFSALAGTAGGFGGGLVGEGTGFALGIVGSAIGAAFDSLVKKGLELAEALNKPIQNIEKLLEALPGLDQPTKELVARLRAAGLEASAAAVVVGKFNQQLKDLGVKDVEKFKQDSKEFRNTVKEVETAFSILAASKFTNFLADIRDLAVALSRLSLDEILDPYNKFPNIISEFNDVREGRGASGPSKPPAASQQQQSIANQFLQLQQASNELEDERVKLIGESTKLSAEDLAVKQAQLNLTAAEIESEKRILDFKNAEKIAEETKNKQISISAKKALEEAVAAERTARATKNRLLDLQEIAREEAKRKILESQIGTNAELGRLQIQEARQKTGQLAALTRERQVLKDSVIDRVRLLNLERARLKAANKGRNLDEAINVLIDRRIRLAEGAGFIGDREIARKIELLELERELTRLTQERTNAANLRAVDKSIESIELQIESPFGGTEYERKALALEQEAELNELLIRQADELNDLEKQRTAKGVSKERKAELTDLINSQKQFNQDLITRISKENELEMVLLKQKQTLEQLQPVTNALASGISDLFVALVDGSKSAEEAFADMLQNMGKALIDQAAIMIAQYIAIGIARSFAGLGTAVGEQSSLPGVGLGSGDGSFTNIAGNEFSTLGPNFGFRTRAVGGPVNPGGTYLVGERGPELLTMTPGGGYVTSNSSSRAAMSRYNTSNTADSTPTFRLETTVINGVEYATVDQVREMGAISAKRGAQMGQSNTMKSLQNSRSQRSRIGMR